MQKEEGDLFDASNAQLFRDKILRTLRIYPKLSPSMLHIGLGPAVPAKVWRPVLDDMIKDGTITATIVPASGSRNYTVLSLSEPTIPAT